jgi:hypothetical protein
MGQRQLSPLRSRSDVNRLDSSIVREGDPQEGLRAPFGRDGDARDAVDKHHNTEVRPVGESPGLLGDLPGPAQLRPHIVGNQGAIDRADHVGASTLSRAAISPPRDAARKASTTSTC